MIKELIFQMMEKGNTPNNAGKKNNFFFRCLKLFFLFIAFLQLMIFRII